jgi:hypothetical protein
MLLHVIYGLFCKARLSFHVIYGCFRCFLPPGRAALPRRPNIPPWGARPPVRRPVRRSALAKVEALAKEGPGCSFSRPRGKPRAH